MSVVMIIALVFLFGSFAYAAFVEKGISSTLLAVWAGVSLYVLGAAFGG